MSARELQRTAVRMLHDPAFLEAVMTAPEAALAGLDLTAAERAMLAGSDRRAWQVDPHRRWRVLTALMREYVVSCSTNTYQPGGLDAFFASPEFHAAIRERESLFTTFPRWLLSRTPEGRRRARGVTALEAAIARVRRAPARPASASIDDAPTLRRAPWVESLRLPAGTLASWQAAMQQLRPTPDADPIEALVKGQVVTYPHMRPGDEHVLIERPVDRQDPVASVIDGALHTLLAAASQAVPRASLAALVEAAGTTHDEAEEVILDLVRDGILLGA